MLADCVRDLRQPGAVFCEFQDVRRGEILDAVRRRIAQRAKQPGGDQDWHIMRFDPWDEPTLFAVVALSALLLSFFERTLPVWR